MALVVGLNDEREGALKHKEGLDNFPKKETDNRGRVSGTKRTETGWLCHQNNECPVLYSRRLLQSHPRSLISPSAVWLEQLRFLTIGGLDSSPEKPFILLRGDRGSFTGPGWTL